MVITLVGMIFLIFLIFQIVVLAVEITMGAGAEARPGYGSGNRTYISGGAANASGTITSVEIWCQSTLNDCEVAIFTEGAANTFTSGDSEVVDNSNGAGVVAQGSKQTFVVNLTVSAGDFIGLFFNSATGIEYSTTLGIGIWNVIGDFIPCTDKEFSLNATREMSIFATGTSVEVAKKKKNVIFMGSNF